MNEHSKLNNQAIGIFDSGLGGLTVASAIAAALPRESLIYLGDTARVPYGTRSGATVVRYARRNIAFLEDCKVKAVVIACNTVSAQGITKLGPLDMPVIGVVRPGAESAFAASRGGPIAVLGTRATIESRAYPTALSALGYHGEVRSVACPLFVPLAEEGWHESPVTKEVARTYLKPLVNSGVDTVILGCTHYPLLRTVITEVVEEICGTGVAIVDSAQAAAQAISSVLQEANLFASSGQLTQRFFVTDAPSRVSAVASRFWNETEQGKPAFEHVDITFTAT